MDNETKQTLKDIRPDLASEWNRTKNGELTAENVTIGSARKVWWICKAGHEYEAQIKSRAHGTGCPYCNGSKVLAGFNDLKSQYPQLAKQFDEEKNGKKASEVHATSRVKYWWKCEEGHNWQATPESRTRSSGCPYCSGRYATKNTSLQSINPTLAAELHPAKNIGLDANLLTSQSNKMVWWLCPSCGHEWEATVNNRAKGRGCPSCTKKRRTH